ncbi:MAG: type ISP restriction/modification enzyme [Candidatus Uhrbacteria bacterium]|nr:type ISP restriction/modification enzyme [Candidatus Uhrbacteria bacterium]
MQKAVEDYIAELSNQYRTGVAREHSYRPALANFLGTLDIKAHVVNEPKHSEFGAPDLVFKQGDLELGYVEAKDIGINLDKVEDSEQMKRYLGYANLILTDYLEFRFYKNGARYGEPVRIGVIPDNKIVGNPEEFNTLTSTIKDFLSSPPERIKSGKRLAEIMGGKARRIRDNAKHFLAEKGDTDTDLVRVYESVKKMLIHDLTTGHFADMYAQTLVYGLFVARYNDETKDTFSREEARELVPASNPFLRQFFDHIAGINFNKRLTYIVDELCVVFAASDIRELVDEYFSRNGAVEGQDPVIHFYEDFLREYDPELRKKMGAYYTPLPVVRFIVREVDQILKKEFGLTDGLADAAKLPNGKHRVQVLDPAVGTGTFLAQVIELTRKTFGENQSGRWPTYVHHDLLPRIHGFELMMAAYVIAHLKLSVEFKKTGFTIFHNRLGIYLTNSLEQAGPQTDLLSLGFSQSIAEEAKQAAVIKNETPIMVILGNPPYSAVSANETPDANKLVEKYKIEPGNKIKLQERKHWLNDDYVKFIALAENMVEKNGEGIMAMITNNGYLDNSTFRGMRWRLTMTFDKIYILDLHGNTKKKEKAPDGNKDENIFDIQQGVGIIVAIKTGKKRKGDLAEVFHTDLFGKRSSKFQSLEKDLPFKQIQLDEKMLYFVPKNIEGKGEYEKGIKLDDLFLENASGIVTMGDNFIVGDTKEIISERVQKLARGDYDENILNHEFDLGKNYAKWIDSNKGSVQFDDAKLTKLSYRPFDDKWTYFDNKLIWRWRKSVMSHFLTRENLGLLVPKAHKDAGYHHVFVTNKISEAIFLSGATGSNAMNLPLYRFTEDGSPAPNLNGEIVKAIGKVVGNTTPEDIFDYIYAALHSPSYREKYREFLKVDFPRVPYPKNKKQFLALVALGRELRGLHLLESPKVQKFITSYPETGPDFIEKVTRKDDKVYINLTQYFGNVPDVAWNFYIGGYQPAQKWLKDRKGRKLADEDIKHYQKIIVALSETGRIMKEIDKIF